MLLTGSACSKCGLNDLTLLVHRAMAVELEFIQMNAKRRDVALGQRSAPRRALCRHHAEARPTATPVPHVHDELHVRAGSSLVWGGLLSHFEVLITHWSWTISCKYGALSCPPRVMGGLGPLEDDSHDWQMGLRCCGYRAVFSHHSWKYICFMTLEKGERSTIYLKMSFLKFNF